MHINKTIVPIKKKKKLFCFAIALIKFVTVKICYKYWNLVNTGIKIYEKKNV